jgi:imidazolonepropionase
MLTLRGSHGARRGAALNELGIIQDGALLIRDGILQEVGPSRRVENLQAARGAIEINAAGRVVMPGFVDSHTHLIFPQPGRSEDLLRSVNSIRTSTANRLASRTRSYLHSMARHGTTTVEAKTGCGPDDRAEIKLLRALAGVQRDPVEVVPTVLMRVPPGAGDSTAAAVDWYCRDFLPKVRQRKLAHFVDAAWDADPAVHGHVARYLAAARSMGFACKIHADGERPAAAITMGVEHFAASIDHLDHASAAEASMMGGADTIATLLPYPSFHRRATPAPARALIEADVAVALASDFNPQHTPNLNMQTVVALACLQMDLTPAEAISAATINGAHALGCADRVGTLECGKSADLLILNLADYRDMAHHFGTNMVHLTMKHGEFIYEEGSVAKRTAAELRLVW